MPLSQLKEGRKGERGRTRQEPLGVWGCQKVGTSGTSTDYRGGGATSWASLMMHFVKIWRTAQRGKERAQSHTALTAFQVLFHMFYHPPSSPLRPGNYCNLYNGEGDVAAWGR